MRKISNIIYILFNIPQPCLRFYIRNYNKITINNDSQSIKRNQ